MVCVAIPTQSTENMFLISILKDSREEEHGLLFALVQQLYYHECVALSFKIKSPPITWQGMPPAFSGS